MFKQLAALIIFVVMATSAEAGILQKNVNLTFDNDKNFTADLNEFLRPEYKNQMRFQVMASLTHACPKWIRLSTAGIVTGSPTKANVGTFTCIFSATGSSGGEAGLRMSITLVDKTPVPAMVCKDGKPARYYGLTPKGDEELFACNK